MIQQLYSTVRTVYTSTISKYISKDTEKRLLVPLHYKFLSKISEKKVISYDNKNVIVSEYDTEMIQSQIEAEKKVLEVFVNETEEEDIIYDIGANVGLYSLILGKKAKKIHAFEPQPANFFRLRENVKHNQMEDTISSHNIALGEKERYLNTTHGMTTFKLNNTSDKSENKTQVVRGDKYKKDQGIENPNIIKIDVEGFEKNVLSGLKQILQKKECRAIFVEVHREVMGEKALSEDEIEYIYDYLESFGFSISTIQDKGEQSNILATK